MAQGPCLAAYQSEVPISIPDLALDDRFPKFVAGAREAGLAAVFTFPLRNDGRCLGALDLYSTTPGDLSVEEMSVAQTLADVTTAYLLNAEARQSKTEFVAMVSHELRTPMTSIAGFVELLEDGADGALTPQQEAFVEAIHRNSDRLRALADDLLTVSSLEAGTFSAEHNLVDFAEALPAVETALQTVISSRELEVSFEVPAEPVMILGDARGLEALVTNLVSNALKFTEDGGWVRCTLKVVAGRARLEVSDNGLGIPESEQPSLFTRFFRSSTAQEHAIQGSGLGLTIVDSIVKSHRGEISVVSAHLRGSTFTVTLPLSSPESESGTDPATVPKQRVSR